MPVSFFHVACSIHCAFVPYTPRMDAWLRKWSTVNAPDEDILRQIGFNQFNF